MSKKIKDKYLELLEKYKNYSGEYRLKIDTPTKAAIYIAISDDRKPIFLFDVPVAFSGYITALHDTAGYKVITDNSIDGFIRVGIIASESSSFEIFYVVVDDLIETVCSQNESASQAIITRLLIWEDFFKNAGNGILGVKEQIGLFGELLFVEEEILNGHLDIIDNWKGPEKGVKDFVINSIAVEVKSTSVTAANRIHISDENQLDSSGFSHLFLNVRMIVQNQMDGRSLPELIDSIKESIGANSPNTIHSLEQKLLHAGYKETFREKYENKYELSDIYWYEVNDIDNHLFPRIIPSDLKVGVKFVNYEIELSTMYPFLINWEEKRAMVESDINEQY